MCVLDVNAAALIQKHFDLDKLHLVNSRQTTIVDVSHIFDSINRKKAFSIYIRLFFIVVGFSKRFILF